MRRTKLLFIFLLFLFSITTLLAQNGLTVTGKITDTETGKGIPFADISLPTGLILSQTDTAGYYTIKNLEPATYVLTISSFGYLNKTEEVDLTSDLILNFSLQPTISTLGPVLLEGTRENNFGINRLKDIEGTAIYAGKKTEVIEVDDLIANTATNNSRQIYSKIPGLNIWESDGTGIQLGIGGRGLNPSRTSNFNTRQNGYDISADPLGYPESYYSPPVEAIDKIEIIRGAGALQYGPQFGGFINFRLKKGPSDKPIELTSRLTGGPFGFFNTFTSIGGTKGKVNYYSFYQYKKGSGWRPNSNFDVHTAYASVTYKPNKKLELTGEYTYMHYLAQQPGGLTDAMFNRDPRQSVRERNWFKVNWNLAALIADYIVNENLKLNTRFFTLIADRSALGLLTPPNRPDLGQDRNLWTDEFSNFGNETRLLYTYNTWENESAFVTGIRYYNGYTFRRNGFSNNGSEGKKDDFSFIDINGLEYEQYAFPSSNVAFFIENIFKITRKFSVTPGIRFERINTKVDGYFNAIRRDGAGNIILNTRVEEERENIRSFLIAGIGTSYEFKREAEIYANISQNYRPINFSDVKSANENVVIDKNLQDETGFTADIGMRGDLQQIFYYDFSAFLISYNNRIAPLNTRDSSNKSILYRSNISESRNIGIESFFEVDIWKIIKGKDAKSKVSLFSNFSLMDARYVSSDDKSIEFNKVELVPSVILKTGLTYKTGRFGVTYQFSYSSKQYTDVTNAENTANAINGVIPAYYIMDLTAEYFFKKRFALFGSVNNFTNNMYFTRRADGYPGPGIIPSDGIGFYLTLQVKL